MDTQDCHEGACSCAHRSLETGGMACHSGMHGEAPGLVRRQEGQGESMGEALYCGFLGKEWTRWDEKV